MAEHRLRARAPNFAFPRHRHLGEERVLVVSGSYREDTGQLYQPGDLHIMQADTNHAYTVGPEGCMLALVTLQGYRHRRRGRVTPFYRARNVEAEAATQSRAPSGRSAASLRAR